MWHLKEKNPQQYQNKHDDFFIITFMMFIVMVNNHYHTGSNDSKIIISVSIVHSYAVYSEVISTEFNYFTPNNYT